MHLSLPPLHLNKFQKMMILLPLTWNLMTFLPYLPCYVSQLVPVSESVSSQSLLDEQDELKQTETPISQTESGNKIFIKILKHINYHFFLELARLYLLEYKQCS